MTVCNPTVIDNIMEASSVNKEEIPSAYPANFTRSMGNITSIQANKTGKPT
jgi:hypothetical protein